MTKEHQRRILDSIADCADLRPADVQKDVGSRDYTSRCNDPHACDW